MTPYYPKKHKHISVYIIILVLLGVSFPSLSQTTYGEIKGTVLNKEQEPVEFATIILKKVADSSLVKFTTTDLMGTYTISQIEYGQYFLEINHINYQIKKTDGFILNLPVKSIDITDIKTKDNLLDEIVISGERNLIEHGLDKTTINVETSILSSVGSAQEVLQSMPGLSVDNNGNISIKGKEGVLVLINGRPTHLSKADLSNFIQTLQSDQISKIEVMENPSARYDAAGNGVINIITKKNQLKGFSGNISTAYKQGKYHDASSNLNLSYNSNKLNIYGTFSYLNRKGIDDYYITRRLRNYNDESIQTIYSQESKGVVSAQGLNGKVGFDYSITNNTTLILNMSAFDNTNEIKANNVTLLLEPDKTLRSQLTAPATTDIGWKNKNADLNLTHKFVKTKSELSLDLDYSSYTSDYSQKILNFTKDKNENENTIPYINNNLFPQDINIFIVKSDYIHPINDKSKIEGGIKTSKVSIDNKATFFEGEGVLLKNDQLSNNFIYNENINAAYLNYSNKFNKWNIQTGLRFEHTDSKGKQLVNNQSFSRNFYQVFPTFFATYTPVDAHQFGLNYGRRIERPDYKSLNPFRYFIDKYTFEEGNPNLQPQFSNNISLDYIYGGGLITTSIYYNKTIDIIQEAILQDVSKSQTFLRPENLSNRQIMGISLNAQVPVFNNFTSSIYLSYNNNKIDGNINNAPFLINVNTFSAQMFHQWKFGNGWSSELGGWFTSRSIEATFIREPVGRLSFGIGKQVINNRGKVRLSVDDIFGWNKFKGASKYQNIDINVENRWQTQTIRLAFTYQFSKGLILKKERTENSSEEVKDRIIIN